MTKSPLLLTTLLVITLTLLTGVVPAATQEIRDDGFVIQKGENVSQTVDRITSTLEEQGFTIIRTIDHATNAKNVGLTLRPTQLILFTDPKIDAKLIHRSQTSAIDVPLKLLV